MWHSCHRPILNHSQFTSKIFVLITLSTKRSPNLSTKRSPNLDQFHSEMPQYIAHFICRAMKVEQTDWSGKVWKEIRPLSITRCPKAVVKLGAKAGIRYLISGKEQASWCLGCQVKTRRETEVLTNLRLFPAREQGGCQCGVIIVIYSTLQQAIAGDVQQRKGKVNFCRR